MKKILLIVLCLMFVGCASSKIAYLPNPIPAQAMRKQANEIQVMFDGPGRPYDVLGLIEFNIFKPGFSAPTLEDALPEVNAKVSQVGGDALILRRNQVDERWISGTGEVIRYRD
jgi:hypothetical protein